jgi:hypothetical protein
VGGALLFEGALRARTVPFTSLPDDTLTDIVRYIGENLREADRAEITATMAGDPVDILTGSVATSTLGWVMLDRTSAPVALLGVAPQGLPGVGAPWLIGANGIEREAVALARQTGVHVDQMLQQYPVLTNHLDARNELALNWLLWSGFDLIDAKTDYGPEGRLFLQFMKAR